MKKTMVQILTVLAVISTATALWAAGVLQTDSAPGKAVVQARKSLMVAVGANMKDINAKLTSGRIGDIAVNAVNLSAMATVLPPLYREKHEGAYPVQGSKSFYKGGASMAFENAATEMKDAADTLQSAATAKDNAAVTEAFGRLKSSCGGCHSVFRGKY